MVRADQDGDGVADRVDADEHQHRHDEQYEDALQAAADDEDGLRRSNLGRGRGGQTPRYACTRSRRAGSSAAGIISATRP